MRPNIFYKTGEEFPAGRVCELSNRTYSFVHFRVTEGPKVYAKPFLEKLHPVDGYPKYGVRDCKEACKGNIRMAFLSYQSWKPGMVLPGTGRPQQAYLDQIRPPASV